MTVEQLIEQVKDARWADVVISLPIAKELLGNMTHQRNALTWKIDE